MARIFVEGYKSRTTVRKYAGPGWITVKVDGGFMLFDSREDLRIWRNQK